MIRLALEADIARLCEIERSAATLFAGTHMAWAADAPGAPPQSYRETLERGSIWVYEADRPIPLARDRAA